METLPRRLRAGLLLALPGFLCSGAMSPANAATEQGSTFAGHVLSILPSAEAGTFFPIIGLIVAISVTQMLRRRKMAQFRSSSSSGH